MLLSLLMSTPRWTGPMSALSAASRTFTTLMSWLVLATLVSASSSSPSSSSPTFPYISSSVLVPGPKQAGNAIFVLAPNGNSVDLLSLNTTSTLQASSLTFQTLTSGVPFLDATSRTTAFTPTILANGTIIVYAGDCLLTTNSAVWTYQPGSTAGSAAGSWTVHGVTANNAPPNFLGAGLAYSSQLAPSVSPPTVYVYGGMCPSLNQTSSTWQGSAVYSNQMARIAPSSDSSTYTVTPLMSRGPPIAEAGFTFTPLAPSITNRSSIVTQQVSGVLLGGHTQQAFINMSTAAVWSLPEETWSFSPIAPPNTPSTELAVKKDVTPRDLPTEVSSRSGHTAVLNEDGTAIIVLGGWVGDVSQAAEPQLAVLEMGAGYGQWRWSIPAAQPSGPGLYGHGAALLPGNVMMVYGGYSISSSSSSATKLKTRQAGSGNTTPMFLNLTSLTWTDSYTNPTGQTSTSGSGGGGGGGDTSSSSSKDRPIGLGLGLGLGIPIVLAIIALLIYYQRRRKRQQRDRDEAVRALAQDHQQFLRDGDDDNNNEMVERDDVNHFPLGWGASAAREWYTGGHDPYGASRRSLGYESLRGGTRSSPSFYPGMSSAAAAAASPRTSGILRTPARQSARGLYQPTTLADYESRAGQRGTGGIHPIQEADEDADAAAVAAVAAAAADDHRSISPDKDEGGGITDPFLTPTGNSSPEPTTPAAAAAPQNHEVQAWVSDVDAAEAMFAAHEAAAAAAAANTTSSSSNQHLRPPAGRTSPPTRRHSTRSRGGGGGGGGGGSSPTTATSSTTRDDDARTTSNLSDRSAISFASRSTSARSRLGLGAAVAALALPAAAAAAAHSGNNKDDPRLGSSSGTSDNSGHSYNTARSSFPALQAEGPGLLLGRGGGGGGGQRDSYYDGDDGGYDEGLDDNDDVTPGSPSKSRPRRSNTVFSKIRRIFSAGTNSPGSTARGDSPDTQPSSSSRFSFDIGSGSEPTATTTLFGLGDLPHATLLRRKQGRRGWEDDDGGDDGAAAGAAGGSSSRTVVGSVVAGRRVVSDGGGAAARMRRRSGMGRGGNEDDEGAAAAEPRGRLSDEWDIEKAARARSFQIAGLTYTVPRDKLRVVNAEVEVEDEGERAEIVNPEDEEEDDEEEDVVDLASAAREGKKAGLDAGLVDRVVESNRPSTPPWLTGRRLEKFRALRDEDDVYRKGWEEDFRRVMEGGEGSDYDDEDDDDDEGGDDEGLLGRGKKSWGRLSAGRRSFTASPSPSPGPDEGEEDAHGSSSTIMTARALRLKRPQTRVLEMVEQIESGSRENSPGRKS